jgi:DNA-directed RNA polymerase subunit RPC12/RpoP
MTVISIVWFLVSMLVWLVMGYMFLAQAAEFNAQHDSASRDLFRTFAFTWIVFGIIAMIFTVICVVAILGAVNNDVYDAAYNRSILIGAVGIFFGLGAGIVLILNAKKNIKVHPKYLATLPVPTPICERCGQPVQFDKDAGGWYCPTCKIHLTKGTKKPTVEKPILPPVAPKPRPKPMGPYPPKPMGPGGPPGGPQVRNVTCGNCGKTFQWNMSDPSIRMAKCPWCNNQVPL